MDPAWLEFEAQVLHVQTDAVKTPTEANITWVQRLALNRWGLRSHGRPRVEKSGWLGGSRTAFVRKRRDGGARFFLRTLKAKVRLYLCFFRLPLFRAVFLFSLPFRILFGGPAFLFGGPAVLFGGSAVLSGGPAILSGDPAVLFGGPAILSGGPAVLLWGPCTLVQFWGIKNGALNSSKSDFTIKALSSRRRHLLLSQGTSSAAQHRTGKHVILDTCGPKKQFLLNSLRK